MRSLMSTLASTAMPIVSARPAMPGSVIVAAERREDRHLQEQVEEHGDVGDDAGLAVVEDHEDEHEAGAGEHALDALLDGVLAERRADERLVRRA